MAVQKVIPQKIESFLMKMRVIGLSELCTEGRSSPNDHLYDGRILILLRTISTFGVKLKYLTIIVS